MTARDTFDLSLSRTIRAPRTKVFDAFVKPELLRKWFGPRGHTITEATIDAKVGGHYRISMQPRTGETYTVGGVYREVAAPSRLVFTWKWEGEEMGAMGETLVTVSLDERRGEHGVETELRLLHSGFPAPEAKAAHNDGWSSSLNCLVDLVDARGSAATVTVFGDPRSSYVRTVRMALAKKGLPTRTSRWRRTAQRSSPSIRSGACRRSATANSRSTRRPQSSVTSTKASPGRHLLARNARLRATMEQWVSRHQLPRATTP